LIQELLVYDWLRCGHRFLPEHLEVEDISQLKKQLWKNMDQSLKGVYNYKSRNEFFKQSVFCRFSGRLLQEVGLSGDADPAIVCFRLERENTVFRLNSCIPLPVSVLTP
jgi:hypothetical protein